MAPHETGGRNQDRKDEPVVSVVIPTLNESRSLPAVLDALRAAAGSVEYEVVIADGGSTDGTRELAAELGCVCVQSDRAQRAAQMNTGAAAARGAILLFLHADTLLPVGSLKKVEVVCAKPGLVGGGFLRRYDSTSRWLRFTCWLAGWRNRGFGWYLGDQAIFVRRGVFARLGGFRDFDVFEDLDFSRRLAREGRLAALGPPVVSSARRFEGHRLFRRSLLDAFLMGRYLFGASPRKLLQAKVRPSTPGQAVPIVQLMKSNARSAEQRQEPAD